MPDLRVKPKPDPEKEAQQRIIIAKLPEMERTLVALIRECRNDISSSPRTHYCVWRERRYPTRFPISAPYLSYSAHWELKGVIERDAGILKLSSRVG